MYIILKVGVRDTSCWPSRMIYCHFSEPENQMFQYVTNVLCWPPSSILYWQSDYRCIYIVLLSTHIRTDKAASLLGCELCYWPSYFLTFQRLIVPLCLGSNTLNCLTQKMKALWHFVTLTSTCPSTQHHFPAVLVWKPQILQLLQSYVLTVLSIASLKKAVPLQAWTAPEGS